MKTPQSGREHADQIISSLKESYLSEPVKNRLDPQFMEHWYKLIIPACEESWTDYVCGKKESYLLTEDEMSALYDKAGHEYVATILDDMVDKDLLEVSIGEGGEILYGLTDTGKEISKKYKKEKDDE